MNEAAETETPVLSPQCFSVLKKRPDFLRASRSLRSARPTLVLQARKRGESEPAQTPIRIGYTCSKKVGNAVMRNRAKRRLRAAAQAVFPSLGQPGWDYVLIGRAGSTAERRYVDILNDLRGALQTVHGR